MTAMRLKRYPSPSGGFALGKMGVGATLMRQGKTARDYVQDGLVVMWDGIENAGWGVHDSTTSSWIDLIGGKVAVLSSGASFGDVACLLPLTNAVYHGGLFSSSWSGVTVELVYRGRSDSGQTYPAAFCSDNDNYSFYFHEASAHRRWAVKWGGNDGNARVFSAQGYELLNGSHHMAFTFENTVSAAGTLTIDGVSWSGGAYNLVDAIRTWQIGGNSTRFLGSDGAMFAVRIYSRALAVSEIAANYAIDKERFNLP